MTALVGACLVDSVKSTRIIAYRIEIVAYLNHGSFAFGNLVSLDSKFKIRHARHLK
jgi:hypothetical protein